ncbi:DUF1848 family protein [Heliophilum fasciatum]|uniref:Uncharacterized protein DUF1848 n=1 Tax=Heliophilum fasciatum TaxID=35700 RepID=A0A4R2RFW7_9FIRM|nr:DUF1848 family protein [Heliophilum fasciatum]MCW2278721.1 DNA repair photolyase [Heliophilum fasciatum]TCP62540.1 uncharacterized protein DUF1848 [Heliophilum fasciatum]
MSIFDGKPIDANKKEANKIILSASRMTDMPKYYPKDLIDEVEKRYVKGMNIHTLVLWTKHPRALLANPLLEYLEKLKKRNIPLYIQLTITGLGEMILGTKKDGKPLVLEPNSPPYIDSLDAIPSLIQLVENPQRIRLRIDPIVRIIDFNQKIFNSLFLFENIVEKASGYGIKHFSFSFLENGMHRKVDKRFKDLGCTIYPPSNDEREKTKVWLKKLEDKYNILISACCVQGFPVTRCIDGELLSQLHPDKEVTSLQQPKKRALCGCTHSIDIGGWPPKKCYTGCDYCYANSQYID